MFVKVVWCIFAKNMQTISLIPIMLSVFTWHNDMFYLCKASALPLMTADPTWFSEL